MGMICLGMMLLAYLIYKCIVLAERLFSLNFKIFKSNNFCNSLMLSFLVFIGFNVRQEEIALGGVSFCNSFIVAPSIPREYLPWC